MARTINVLFIHGIRTDTKGYSDWMNDQVRQRLKKAGHVDKVEFREVFWADTVRDKQKKYLASLRTHGLPPQGALREFVVQGLGDAAAYAPTGGRDGVYHQVQDCIHRKLKELDDSSDPERPLVFVTHSLGCHIMSSFLWDMRKLRHLPTDQRGDPRYEGVDFDAFEKASPLRRLETVAGIVTCGNNMPLFAFSYPGSQIYTVNKPRHHMPPAFPAERVQGGALEAASWINIYSKRDPLGYPLGPLTTNYEHDERIEDIPYAVEGLLAWPFFGMIDAHTRYWKSSFVAKKTADLLKRLIESDKAAEPARAPATVA